MLEARTLSKLLGADATSLWPPVVDAISVARGYEAALGAALGDDLDASTEDSAPAHWSLTPGSAESRASLGRRGLGNSRLGAAGPRAPSRPDRRRHARGGQATERAFKARPAAGFRARRSLALGRLGPAAEAPTPAARRLVEKNRLGDLERDAEAARQAVEVVRAEAARAAQTLREAESAEQQARFGARAARVAQDIAREAVADFERKRVQVLSRLSAMEDASARAKSARDETAERKAEAEFALAELAPTDELALALERAR